MASNSSSYPPGRVFLFRREISLLLSIFLVLATGFLVHYFSPKPAPMVMVSAKTNDCPQTIDEVHLKNGKLTQPLLFADLPRENAELSDLKDKINELITRDKSMNLASSISVYFRKMDNGESFVIGGEKKYQPASLMKVVFLISILKQANSNPELLNKKVYFDHRIKTGFQQNIKNFSLQEKRYYTIRDLLNYMITYSDNDALVLISGQTDNIIYNNIYKDIGLVTAPSDRAQALDYTMTVSEYSRLFRILYNSGYLTEENSEFALKLLTQSTYRGGLLKDIDPSFPVAHKFGERILPGTGSNQLHEVGIFYAEPEPYLLGVMTEGRDLNQLSTVLSEISRLVYQYNNKGI